MQRNLLFRSGVLFCAVVVLAVGFGCGGPQNPPLSPVPDENTPPTVSAGDDQTVPSGIEVTLVATGQDADADELTYSWTQTAGESVVLATANTATATFTSPGSSGEPIILTFKVTVSDGSDAASDTVTVNINNLPTVSAGDDQTVPSGIEVTLVATGQDADGGELTYSWTQTSGPEVVLSGADSATATFSAPGPTGEPIVLTFQVTMSDGSNITSDAVTISINNPPTVSAGEDKNVESGSEVVLAAVAQDPDGDTLSFSWTQTSGPEVVLTGADTSTPTFTAPAATTESVFVTFEVTVSDGKESVSDIVAVTVSPISAGSAWYLHAIAISLDDIGGTLLPDLGFFSFYLPAAGVLKAEASAGATDLLGDLLDEAKDKEFDDAFIQIDLDDEVFGSGYMFELVDADNNYETVAIGFLAVKLSADGLLAEQLGIPLRLRANGPIIAVRLETIEAIGSVVEGLVESSLSDIEELIGENNAEIINNMIATWSDLASEPGYPNLEGIFSFADEWEFPIYLPGINPGEPDEIAFNVNFTVEIDVERNVAGDRWMGAITETILVQDASGQTEDQTLNVTVAVGAQRIDNPEVVYIEPGSGEIVEGSRLAGSWTATFSTQEIFGEGNGMFDTYGFARVVFDENGKWIDLLVAGSSDGSGSIPPDDEFISLQAVLANPEEYFGPMPPELPSLDVELRTTLTAGGHVRLDFIVTNLETFLEYLETTLSPWELFPAFNPLLSSLPARSNADVIWNAVSTSVANDVDLSGLPELPVFSFIGNISGDALDGNLLFLLLYEPATFNR